ncbi:hypothetical protein DL766_000815 [Monosporascus sp. MC13-8B]|uniref:Myb-like DNA-binding domain-containing protein n=1 Tax=Monosporascus cannonballus TaxID=155416 RepID=A0ABY0HHC3_9PEZI|nr:hypothetical protein DL762_001124 [Monosporascus cannonballus]RYO98401.1 hypothetical protein DL763_002240 [Monosporascus cannonballus]RYP38815.1 hypothetical protein DL766_000815 [Monosporascus sp. MC13-8B]
MPPIDTESQFKFLIACIKHSQAGKVDFAAVANECGIVSKGAAAKRYERLMKQHGISPSSGAGGSAVKKEAKEPKTPAKTRKKRKLEQVEEDVGDIDEPIKGEVKNEYETTIKTEIVKSEAGVKSESVKMEGGGSATILATQPRTPPPASPALAVKSQNDDDEDEVLIVSATEKTSTARIPGVIAANHHHHHHAHAHSHSPSPTVIPGTHSFDHAANMHFPQQMMERPTMSNTFPYGFGAGPWFHPQDTSTGYGHFWQGIGSSEQHNGVDHDTRRDG